jgi:hypothetical protein
MGQLTLCEPSTANKLTELIDGRIVQRRRMTFIREGRIPVVNGDSSYTQFLDKYLRALKPCLISGLTTVWTATREWTCRDPSTGKLIPNFSLLKELFGVETGCITFCSETDHHGELIQRELPVSSFIASFSNDASRKTYLKDFHFMRPVRKPPYSVPQFFAGWSLAGGRLM